MPADMWDYKDARGRVGEVGFKITVVAPENAESDLAPLLRSILTPPVHTSTSTNRCETYACMNCWERDNDHAGQTSTISVERLTIGAYLLRK